MKDQSRIYVGWKILHKLKEANYSGIHANYPGIYAAYLGINDTGHL